MNLTVALRVIGGFAITSILLLILGVNSVSVLHDISDSSQDVNQISVPALESSAKLQLQFLHMSKTTLIDYYANDDETTDSAVATFQQQASIFTDELALVKQTVASSEVLSTELKQVETQYQSFNDVAQRLFNAKKKSLAYQEKIGELLDETETAADDAATYALDFIDYNELNNTDKKLATVTAQLESYMIRVISAVTEIAEENNPATIKTVINELSINQTAVENLFKDFKSMTEGRSYEAYDDLVEQFDLLFNLLNSPQSIQKTKLAWLEQVELTDNLLEQTNTQITEAIEQLNELAKLVKTQLSNTTSEVTQSVEDGVSHSWIVMLASLVASIFIAFQTVIRVTRPLAEVNSVLKVVATGDLTTKLDDSSNDEFGELARNCNQLIDSLRTLINGIVTRSNQLATAAEETSMVVKDSTVAINDQRSQVEQAATATTEMASTSSAVMDRANEALDDIKHADEEAERVKVISDDNKQTIIKLAQEIEQASHVINEVNNHSASIGGILDVIRGVAEQTNLLALNAAIEAARAGEQGRGFAVVADEVRSLASKTQESTEEIQTMIEQLQKGSKSAVLVMNNSKSQAELCVEQTEQAGIALNSITDSVHQANDMSEQIVTAAQEQNTVSSEISERLESIVAIAEQTAAGSDQTAQSSQEVARLAEELRQSVEQFKL